jgi:TonB family protein
MSNAANGARQSRQTIFFPPEIQTEDSDCPTGPVRLASEEKADNERVKLFYLEAEAAALLQHPRIAHAHAAEPFADSHLRQESHLPGGETLREVLTKEGWFAPLRALQIIAQVADGIAYAHGAGVLHLNLQPEHIWLDSNDRVLITGFGIADDTSLEWARHLRARSCAPSYLSPEQFNGQMGDRASDVYALGVILYEMLTDRVPFDSNDIDQLQHRHKTRMPRPPHELNHQLPPELSETVMELLSRNPKSRLRKFAETNIFNPMPVHSRPVKDAAPAVTCSASASQRMTNPMPLSELAAEINASSTALVARPIDKLISRRFLPFTLFGPQWHSRPWVRTGLALLSLAMLSCFLVPGMQKLSSWRKVPASSEQPTLVNQASPAHGTTAELALRESSSIAPEAAPSKAVEPVPENSGSPVKAGRTEAGASGDMVVAPSGLPGAEGVAKMGNFAFGAPLKRVKPTYPSSARARRESGEVVVDVFVSEKGKVTSADAVSGPGLFRKSAVAAARQWRFAPTTFNGVPVKVHRMITFRYDPSERLAAKGKLRRVRSRSQDTYLHTPRAQRKSRNKFLRPFRSMVRKFKK